MTPIYNNDSSKSTLCKVNTSEPCIHCGKPDWCYKVGSLTVCKRGAEPAQGWEATSKVDKDGTPYYAPATVKKEIRGKSRKEFIYCDRQGDPLIKVVRIDDGNGKKSFPQYHWNGKWIKGVPTEIQQQVPIYRYQEVREAIASGRTIYLVEGEGVADALCAIGLTATTTLGGSGKYRSYGNYRDDLAGAELALCPDRDEPGLKHMEEVAKDFPHAEWLYAPPSDFFWQHLPKSGGLDVGDWLSGGATAEEIEEVVGDKMYSSPVVTTVVDDQELLETDDGQLLTAPTPEEEFTQKAYDALFSHTRCIALDGNLYRWTGTHYALTSTPAEKARIAQWCNSTPVETSKGWRYAYAKPHIIESIWNWILGLLSIDPRLVNPPGLNCLSGVLVISWRGKIPSWHLAPHSPDIIYTYVGEFYFNPGADSKGCDLLLSCLEPDHREIFLRTLAASLDLTKIRKLRSQRIRALLCKGDGNNGKDSLREAVQLLYGGSGVISTTVDDFAQYQQGRKFTLAKLNQARVSWSSENSNFSQLDRLQSLKAAITGEAIDYEAKNVQERPMNPCCIFLFNINDVPNLQASMEAMQSRWAILSFTKTFKVNADPSKGEVEADPRFRYDPDFLQQDVVPALLNKMLEALPEVAAAPIDYTCTEQALQEIRQQSNHLLEFCQEIGLDYRPGERVYLGDLWDKLSQWYVDNGIAEITIPIKGSQKKERLEFICEPARRGDKYIKASKYLYPRLSELFPKIKKERDYSHGERHGLFYLFGMGFGSPDGSSGSPDGSPNGSPETCSESLGSLGSLSKPTLTYALEVVSKLSPTEQRALINFISKGVNDSDPSDPRLSGRVSGDPLGDPSGDPDDPSGDPQVIQPSRSTIAANRSKASLKKVTAADGSNVVGGIGNVGHNTSTKNFATKPPSPKLKVGDKCKAKRPDLWGVPPDKVLTIRAIDKDSEGDLALVTFQGCRSLVGSPVLLSDLFPVAVKE